MNTLLIYMAKVSVYLVAFYLVYSLMLSRDTSYSRNRIFILLSLAMATVLPLITLQTVKPLDIQYFGKFLSEVFITDKSGVEATLNSGLADATPLKIVYVIYIVGVFISIFKLLTDILNLSFLILRQKRSGSHIIRFHGSDTAGFSAMGYIFINTRLNQEEETEIIKHEQNHLQQNHFFDILFVELVKAVQWFNPVIYLFNRSLRAIHEYQADLNCLNSGVPMIKYQNLLLSQVFKSKAFNLTNSFSNPSLIKKRMIMMTKKRTSSFANMKLLFVIPVTCLVILAISGYKEIPYLPEQQIISTTDSQSSNTTSSTALISDQSENNPEPELPPPPPPPVSYQAENIVEEDVVEPFEVVEEMPLFPGGDMELIKYIVEATNYPAGAKENNRQGRVIVRFCITAKGDISQVSVLKGVDPELDSEAIRVVKTLPPFTPGKQGGKAVPVWYMVPITFALK